ncbi:hypothetical protein, partial [Roseibacillus ishigakijimensis]|uniref:hypothetical protein n=1 Tax=Roseibacillus ishigakijimensis TaxID=454146 RepID=UPI001F454437
KFPLVKIDFPREQVNDPLANRHFPGVRAEFPLETEEIPLEQSLVRGKTSGRVPGSPAHVPF